MLSSVLRSKRAVEINIAIMRTFVRLREMLADNAWLRRIIEKHDEQIKYIFNILAQMKKLPEPKKPGRPFGFHGRKPQGKLNSGKAIKLKSTQTHIDSRLKRLNRGLWQTGL
jgi:predicted RNA-binding protein with EMAP domain